MKDWLMELCPEIAEWQAEIIAEQVRIRVESEREACAKLCEAEAEKWEGKDGPVCFEVRLCSDAIRARGEK